MTSYKHTPSIGVRSFDDILILLDPEHAVLHEVNVVGAKVWELCDGERTVQDIVEQITQEFDVSVDEAEMDIRSFLFLLEQRGLLKPNGKI